MERKLCFGGLEFREGKGGEEKVEGTENRLYRRKKDMGKGGRKGGREGGRGRDENERRGRQEGKYRKEERESRKKGPFV